MMTVNKILNDSLNEDLKEKVDFAFRSNKSRYNSDVMASYNTI
jgi:hypothetical protein